MVNSFLSTRYKDRGVILLDFLFNFVNIGIPPTLDKIRTLAENDNWVRLGYRLGGRAPAARQARGKFAADR